MERSTRTSAEKYRRIVSKKKMDEAGKNNKTEGRRKREEEEFANLDLKPWVVDGDYY
jgi:hypothetical protein